MDILRKMLKCVWRELQGLHALYRIGRSGGKTTLTLRSNGPLACCRGETSDRDSEPLKLEQRWLLGRIGRGTRNARFDEHLIFSGRLSFD